MAGSRIVPLRRPSDGLVARLSLIEEAAHTLDLQYYIWESDPVGHLILVRALEAADRGVAVRLLVDDLKVRRMSRTIACLGLHPNLEIQVFNPWTRRSSDLARLFESVARRGLDERMHNKMMLADGENAIFGGRNIGASHFGLGRSFNLVDFDVLVRGDQVSALGQVFELYWSSPSTVSGGELAEGVTEADLTTTRREIAEDLEKEGPILATVLGEEASWPRREDEISQPLSVGSTSVVADDPAVEEGTEAAEVGRALHRAVDRAGEEVVVVTPFFVPGDTEIAWYTRMVQRGVRIRILTNSLASNEGTISNSGLKKQRRHLLDAGVELHELRTDAADKGKWEVSPRVARYLGLHAKFYAIDANKMIVGSVNLDPRSKVINTEMGVLIEDEAVTREIREAALSLMAPENSWRVELGSNGKPTWVNDESVVRRQPARSEMQRLGDWVLGLLPLEHYI